jgi:hypothetical protein
MAETSGDRAQAITASLAALPPGSSEDLQMAVVKGTIPQPSVAWIGYLWAGLVGGLLAILVIALLAIVGVIGNTGSQDKVITIFTAVLTGLIGLFAPSPTQKT